MLRAANIDRWGFPTPGPQAPASYDVASVVVLDTSLPPLKRKRGPRSERYARMLGCLREMCETRKPGETFSYTQIGKACNVSGEYIKQVERSACKKLRERLTHFQQEIQQAS